MNGVDSCFGAGTSYDGGMYGVGTGNGGFDTGASYAYSGEMYGICTGAGVGVGTTGNGAVIRVGINKICAGLVGVTLTPNGFGPHL